MTPEKTHLLADRIVTAFESARERLQDVNRRKVRLHPLAQQASFSKSSHILMLPTFIAHERRLAGTISDDYATLVYGGVILSRHAE